MSGPLSREVVVFNEALVLRSAERTAYLDRACAGDAALRCQVESLLQANENAEQFLELPLISPGIQGAEIQHQPAAGNLGDRIARYHLLQQIGEGGCGVVYLAEQEEPVRRKVALKILKLGMDTKQVIARFEAERQVLAMMDHPNIAKVFDAGATESGRPYFVMELVGGVKITEFADEHKLSTTERLRLFIQVCQAIQHAHQKGVIHRDIKPSNILVTINDGGPLPKVIDFGIAKATQGRLTDHTQFTALEQFVGTPAYMSPEQAAVTSMDIDTRSDIYSLGVLLYELLTGRTPFDQKELLAAGLDEMRRTIREVEPVKPSTRLTQSHVADDVRRRSLVESQPSASSPRRLQELIRSVRGDLDWIVMKCLEKDRARRYETANGLASDLQRHLNHEPVSARPPGNWYRFRKLVQRNKLAFAAISVLVAALMIVAAGSTIAAWRVAGARRAEQSEREKAETANRQLRQTVSLLELERAEDFFNAHDAASGVAHLSAMLRRDPSNSIAANRLVSALTQRGWAVPRGTPMQHVGQIPAASFSPDGRRVLTASWDSTAAVWDVVDEKRLFSLQHADATYAAHYSPDGRRIVTASADGIAQICDAVTGTVQSTLRHGNKVHWAEFSRDGAFVLTACADQVARIWDAGTGELKRELRGHSRPILVARFAPDGQLVASATDWGGLRLWSSESGKLIHKLAGHEDFTAIETLAFSPDGQRLVSGGMDHTTRLWDVATGKRIGEPIMHRLRVWHGGFSPDGKLLLTACEDGAARLWDAQTTRQVGERMRHESGVIFGQFSPSGESVVTTSSDNTARVWDVRTRTPLCQPLRHLRKVMSASFSADGRRLVTASADGTAQVWELRLPLEPGVQIEHDRNVAPIAVTHDGATILTAGQNKTLRLWDARTGQPLSEPMVQTEFVAFGDFSPDGRRVAVAFTDHTIRVWEVGEWKALRGTKAGPSVAAGPMQQEKRIRSVRFNADGSRVVTASIDGTARVWNAINGQLITAALVHRAEVTTAQFSRDGSRVVTASDDFTARIWDAQTGRPLAGPLAHIDHVKWAEFSPDGESVITASTDNTACLWDARTGRKLLTLQHARIVQRAAFSPDGRRLATASLDRTAQIWDAHTGQALTPPLRHEGPVTQVRFTADARRIFTTAWTDPVAPARLWDSDTGRPLTEWMNVEDSWGVTCFDPIDGRVFIGARSGIARVWHLAEAPMPVPEWFPKFAETLAGIRLGARGSVELVSRSDLEQMARQFPPGGGGDFYARLARQFLADQDRPREGEGVGDEWRNEKEPKVLYPRGR